MKRITLWQYEDLIKKLIILKAYPVLWQAYKQDMSLAANFARRLFPNQNIEAGEYPARVHYMMEHLKSDKISKWDDPFPSVATRSDCEAFVSDHKLKFEEFIDLLNYLLRWAFPFQTASRELLDHENLQEMAYYGMLKQNNLMNSFILLEQGTH